MTPPKCWKAGTQYNPVNTVITQRRGKYASNVVQACQIIYGWREGIQSKLGIML